jgi:hypothetical protein
MNLNEIIFTDGQILSYENIADVFVVQFVDYANRKIEIEFRGDVEYQNNDGINVEFANSTLLNKNNKNELKLFDDEKNCLFKISFISANYRVTMN